MSISISDLRENYAKNELSEDQVSDSPFDLFSSWLTEAIDAKILEPNAMNLATVSAEGKPSSRIVLLKEVTEEGFVFFTNYKSKKATDLESNPNAALNFLWKEMERQVRIEGKVQKISKEDSEKYFHSRPYGSQIGAISSQQSRVISSRDILEMRYEENYQKYEKEGKAPLPSFWGGYILRPNYFEFWQGRKSRLHDRLEYQNHDEGWSLKRLEP